MLRKRYICMDPVTGEILRHGSRANSVGDDRHAALRRSEGDLTRAVVFEMVEVQSDEGEGLGPACGAKFEHGVETSLSGLEGGETMTNLPMSTNRQLIGATRALIDGNIAIVKALEMAAGLGQFDGGHHKAWAIDQMVRILCGDDYDRFVANAKDGEEGPETYGWDEGIAP